MLDTWLPALDTGEGSLNKKAVFTLTSNLSVIRNKVAPRPVGGGIWVMGALRTLPVVPHNVHALPHQPRNAHLAQFVVRILHVCVANSRCGLKPLAQQVHLEPHLAKPMSATPSLLCLCVCAAFLSKTSWWQVASVFPAADIARDKTFMQHSKILDVHQYIFA